MDSITFDDVAVIKKEIRSAAAHHAIGRLVRRIHDLEIINRDLKAGPVEAPKKLSEQKSYDKANGRLVGGRRTGD